MTLADLGWDESFADAFQPYEKEGLTPFRVSARHRSDYELLDGDGNAVRADSPPDVIAAVG
ncbi:MAG: hypothetical protein QOE36_2719, partial [Gaiellaceae bacterium]|nr:hypothetical protein [Gaiellaceae bacterium]